MHKNHVHIFDKKKKEVATIQWLS